jgi:PhnB protein
VVTGVTPYICPSDAGAAAELYETAFGATVLSRMPMDDGKRLMHCHLVINGGPLMLADACPEYGYPYEAPQGYTLHLQVEDVDAAWARAVAAGLEITLPLDTQFWGDRYGKLRDRFGIAWSIGGK